MEPTGRYFQAWGMRGVALVPLVLRRAWQGRPVPDPLAQLLGAHDACWEALDASIWEGLTVDPGHVSNAVAAAVDGALLRRDRALLADEPVLRDPWPEDLDLAGIPFRTRTLNVVERLTTGPNPVSPGRLTVGLLLDAKRSGVVTLLDFGCTAEATLEAHRQADVGRRRRAPGADFDLLGLWQEPWTTGVAGDDRRFGDLLGPVWRGSVAELVAMGTPQAKSDLRDMLPALRRRLTRLESAPLEEALATYVEALMGLTSREAQLRALLARLGLRGEPPTSLQEAGDLASLTRERVRQLEAKAIERRQSAACPVPYLPQLDAALSRVADALPMAARDVPSVLLADGIASTSFGAESLSAAAAFLGRNLPYATVGSGDETVLVAHGSSLGAEQATVIRAAARAQAAKVGAANCMDLARELGDSVAAIDYEQLTLVVSTGAGAVMGDAGWFWFVDEETPLTSFTRVSLGMLAVKAPLSARSLLAGLRRRAAFRGLPTLPPAHVLEQVYESHPSFVVGDDHLVWPVERLDPEAVLGDLDRQVLQILRTAPAQTLDKTHLLRACRSAGLNAASVSKYLVYSPSIEEVGDDSFAPRGAATAAIGPVAAMPAPADRSASPTVMSSRRRLVPDELRRPLADAFPQFPPAVLPYVHLLHTADRMQGLFEELWAAAEDEVLAFSRPPFSTAAGVVLPAVVDALARGVVARAVYESPGVDDPLARGFREEVDAYVDAGVQARVVDQLPMKLVVFDRHVSLVALADEAVEVGYPTNLIIDHAGFAEVQADAFERRWEAARAYVRPGLVRRRAPRRAQGTGA